MNTERKHQSLIRPGEILRIRHCGSTIGIAEAQCINNDPITEKMLVLIVWGYKDGDNKYDYITLSYYDDAFKDFHLLNSYYLPLHHSGSIENKKETSEIDETNIASLQNAINKAIEKEDYETAQKLQEKIDKLLNNK